MRKTETNSGFNLLRIIMMLQIVYGHFMLYGGIKERILEIGESKELIYRFLYFTSRCPVYILIALSGYFLINRQEIFSYCKKKIWGTWSVMLFYSILLGFVLPTVVMVFGQGDAFSVKAIVRNFVVGLLPVSSNAWYYMTNYILVLAIVPLLNKLSEFTKKQYQYILCVGFIVLSVWPLAESIVSIFDMNYIVDHMSGKSFLNFVYMYCLGGYIRRFYDKKQFNKYLLAAIYFACAIVNMVFYYMFSFYQESSGWNDNPFSVIQVVCLILFFKDLRIHSVVIDKISKVNIGVYLITEYGFVRSRLWNKLNVDVVWSDNAILLWIKIIVVVFLVYGICGCVEKIRSIILSRIVEKYKKVISG